MSLPKVLALSRQTRAAQHTVGSHLYVCWKLGVGQILVLRFTGTVVLKAFWGAHALLWKSYGTSKLFPDKHQHTTCQFQGIHRLP